MHSFASAAGHSGDLATGQEQPESTPLYDLIKAAVKARADIMFSGETGAPVASCIKDDAARSEKPTYGLVASRIEVVFNDLPDELFNQFAEHRPCGVIDRYEAVGQLMVDACGLPLLPQRPQAFELGNKGQGAQAPAEDRVRD